MLKISITTITMNIYKVIAFIIMITFKKAFPDCRPVFSFVYPANIENYSVFNEINDFSVYLYLTYHLYQ